MKGDISPEMMAAVILAIAVLAALWSMIFQGTIQPGDIGKGASAGECEYNYDCTDKQLCVSVDGDKYSCGCLQKDDCNGGDCVDNKCQ